MTDRTRDGARAANAEIEDVTRVELPEVPSTPTTLSEASEPEASRIREAMAQIDLNDAGSIVQFGSTAQAELQEISQSILADVKNKDVGPAGDALRQVVTTIRGFSVAELDVRRDRSWWEKIVGRTAPFANVEDEGELAAAIDRIGRPSILKTRRMGYDGKGQVRIGEGPAEWTGAPSVLEGFVDFSAEISVIIARGADGQVAAFDPGLNVHEGGILRTTTIPCGQPARVTTDAVLMAAQIANALDYVGVLGVELFVTPDGLIVNEIAPRVHNSGHWTQAGCAVDQFEQHIRAVAGLPLGDGKRHADVVMENLIGDDLDRVPALLAEPKVQLHLYGKGDPRPGRKMGHANRITQ